MNNQAVGDNHKLRSMLRSTKLAFGFFSRVKELRKYYGTEEPNELNQSDTYTTNDIANADIKRHNDYANYSNYNNGFNSNEQNRKNFCNTVGCIARASSDPLRCPHRCPKLGCPTVEQINSYIHQQT